MGLDRGVTPDLVDLAALRSYLVAHAVPGLDDVVASDDGSSVHRRLVAVDGAGPVLLTVTLPPRRARIASGHGRGLLG